MKKFQRFFAFSLLIVSFAASSVCSAAEKRVFKVGMECAYAPYNWSQPNDKGGAVEISDSSGEYANGYDVIMAKRIASAMGAELQIVKIEWDGIPPAIESGKIDAAVAGMSMTAQHKFAVDFTVPYYFAKIVALARKDAPQSEAKSIADLAGSSATSQLNTSWYDEIDQIPDVKKLTAVDSVPTMIVTLESGKCDLLVLDIATAMAAAYANPELVVLDFPEGKGFVTSKEDLEVGIAVRKGNTELLNEINGILGKMTMEDFRDVMEEAIQNQPLLQLEN